MTDQAKTAAADLPSDVYLRLSGQRALWGAVTPNLRSVSCDIEGDDIIAQAVFERPPSDLEEELFSSACGYIIGDYSTGMIHERIEVSNAPLRELSLRLRLYERYEAA